MPYKQGVFPLWNRPISSGMSPADQQYFHHVGEKSQEAQRLLEKDDIRGALAAADEALRRAGSRPHSMLIADELSPVYMRAGKFEIAASLYGYRANPGNLSLNAAMAFVRTGRFDEARKAYKEVQLLRYHPEFKPYMPGAATHQQMETTIFLGRGFISYDYGQYGTALWALEHAVRLVPHNALTQYCYAQALVKRNRHREALRFFDLAAQLDSGIIGTRSRGKLARMKSSGSV